MREPAELVLHGPVYTVDAARSWSDAVAVRDGRILALGRSSVAEVTGRGTQVLDARAGLVLPGFQDAHVHPAFAGRELRAVNLHDLPGRQHYLDRVAGYAAAHPDRSWIVGGGWALEHFPEGSPRREDLDAIVPDRPVFLVNRDWHGAWVNSVMLRLAGIDAGTPDPADGRIDRDPITGGPSGMLHEGAAYALNDRLVPQPDQQEWVASIEEAQRELHRLGITGWQDAWVTPQTQQAYQAMADAGALTARVVGALWWDRHRGLEQVIELVRRRGEARVGEHLDPAPDASPAAAGEFHPGTVKIMVDGILENQTGALLEPYVGRGGSDPNAGHRGLTYVDREVLLPAVVELDRLGFQVHLHAIGDRAVRDSLDAVAAARTANGTRDRRHHIAHLQIVQPPDIPRFRQLGVVANCQAFWAQSEPQMDALTIPIIGAERARMQYPFGDLHAAGAMLAMGSDWPVTTADPLQQIEVAVRRIDPEHRENPPFLPEQRISLPTAVAAFTAGSAYVNHDRLGGTIATGQRADLAVLDRNLFDRDAGPPGEAQVRLTVAGGRIVHQV